MKKYYLIIFTIFYFACALQAQNLKEDLLAIGAEYGIHKSFHMEVEVTVYDNAISNTIKRQMRGNVYKDDKHYAYDIDDYSFLINDKAMLMVDHSDQTILYEDVGGQENLDKLYNSFDVGNTLAQLDTMLKYTEQIKYLGIINGYKQYILKNDLSLIQTTHLYIHPDNNTLNRIVYYYDTEKYSGGSPVEVNYPVIDFAFTEFDKYLSLDKFVTTTSDGLIGVNHCKGYEVVTEP